MPSIREMEDSNLDVKLCVENFRQLCIQIGKSKTTECEHILKKTQSLSGKKDVGFQQIYRKDLKEAKHTD